MSDILGNFISSVTNQKEEQFNIVITSALIDDWIAKGEKEKKNLEERKAAYEQYIKEVNDVLKQNPKITEVKLSLQEFPIQSPLTQAEELRLHFLETMHCIHEARTCLIKTLNNTFYLQYLDECLLADVIARHVSNAYNEFKNGDVKRARGLVLPLTKQERDVISNSINESVARAEVLKKTLEQLNSLFTTNVAAISNTNLHNLSKCSGTYRTLQPELKGVSFNMATISQTGALQLNAKELEELSNILYENRKDVVSYGEQLEKALLTSLGSQVSGLSQMLSELSEANQNRNKNQSSTKAKENEKQSTNSYGYIDGDVNAKLELNEDDKVILSVDNLGSDDSEIENTKKDENAKEPTVKSSSLKAKERSVSNENLIYGDYLNYDSRGFCRSSIDEQIAVKGIDLSKVRKILIYGAPGSGKSTIIRALLDKQSRGLISKGFEIVDLETVEPTTRARYMKSVNEFGIYGAADQSPKNYFSTEYLWVTIYNSTEQIYDSRRIDRDAQAITKKDQRAYDQTKFICGDYAKNVHLNNDNLILAVENLIHLANKVVKNYIPKLKLPDSQEFVNLSDYSIVKKEIPARKDRDTITVNVENTVESDPQKALYYDLNTSKLEDLLRGNPLKSFLGYGPDYRKWVRIPGGGYYDSSPLCFMPNLPSKKISAPYNKRYLELVHDSIKKSKTTYDSRFKIIENAFNKMYAKLVDDKKIVYNEVEQKFLLKDIEVLAYDAFLPLPPENFVYNGKRNRSNVDVLTRTSKQGKKFIKRFLREVYKLFPDSNTRIQALMAITNPALLAPGTRQVAADQNLHIKFNSFEKKCFAYYTSISQEYVRTSFLRAKYMLENDPSVYCPKIKGKKSTAADIVMSNGSYYYKKDYITYINPLFYSNRPEENVHAEGTFIFQRVDIVPRIEPVLKERYKSFSEGKFLDLEYRASLIIKNQDRSNIRGLRTNGPDSNYVWNINKEKDPVWQTTDKIDLTSDEAFVKYIDDENADLSLIQGKMRYLTFQSNLESLQHTLYSPCQLSEFVHQAYNEYLVTTEKAILNHDYGIDQNLYITCKQNPPDGAFIRVRGMFPCDPLFNLPDICVGNIIGHPLEVGIVGLPNSYEGSLVYISVKSILADTDPAKTAISHFDTTNSESVITSTIEYSEVFGQIGTSQWMYFVDCLSNWTGSYFGRRFMLWALLSGLSLTSLVNIMTASFGNLVDISYRHNGTEEERYEIFKELTNNMYGSAYSYLQTHFKEADPITELHIPTQFLNYEVKPVSYTIVDNGIVHQVSNFRTGGTDDQINFDYSKTLNKEKIYENLDNERCKAWRKKCSVNASYGAGSHFGVYIDEKGFHPNVSGSLNRLFIPENKRWGDNICLRIASGCYMLKGLDKCIQAALDEIDAGPIEAYFVGAKWFLQVISSDQNYLQDFVDSMDLEVDGEGKRIKEFLIRTDPKIKEALNENQSSKIPVDICCSWIDVINSFLNTDISSKYPVNVCKDMFK